VASKFTVKTIKKKLFFHEICQDLGVELYEDEFDFVYLQSLSIFLLDQEHSWADIFQLPDVRKAFHTGYPTNELDEFNQLLDHHLHVTIKKGPLKQLNAIPVGLVDSFIKAYSEQVKENLQPSIMEAVRATTEFREENREQYNDLKEMIGQIGRAQNVPGDQYIQRGEFEETIDTEHQAQLNLIKKAVEQHQWDSALQSLLELKERVWEKTTQTIKFKLLNNIGYVYMQQHDYDQAINFYEQACTYDPDNASNLLNLCGLYFIRKQYDKAAPLIEKIKDSHPGMVFSLTLYQQDDTETIETLERSVPDELKDDAEVLVTLINLAVKKESKKAADYAKRLYESDRDNQNYRDIFCNISCVSIIGERVDFSVTELMSEPDLAYLRLSRELLEKQWNEVKHTEARKYLLPVLDKLNLVLTVLGEQDAALKVAQEILTENPDSYFGKKQAGLNLMFLARYEEAAKQFAEIGEDHENLFEYHTSWLLALGKTNRMEDAKRVGLKLLENEKHLAEDEFRIYSTLGFLYSENEQYTEALTFIEKAASINSNNLNVLADKAKVQGRLKQINAAKKTEDQMLRVMQDHMAEQSVKDRYLAAHYFRSVKRFKETADLLETIANPAKDHFLTHELIHAYMNSGRKAKALGICTNLRAHYGISRDYTIREIEIYYHYHDYQQAETVLAAYVYQYPDDLQAKLNLAGLQRRNGHLAELKAFCEDDLSHYRFTHNEMRGYIELLNSQGYHQKCLQLIYEYRRMHPGMESNKLFVDYCLSEPDDRKNAELPKQVGKDTVVTLQSGSVTFRYIIIDKPDVDLKKHDGEINLNDRVFKKLKGLRLGQKTKLNDADAMNKWTVAKILPLYMAIFQQAVEENSTIYAASSQYITAEIKNVGDIERFIDGQMKQQRRFNELMAEQEKYYEGYQLPLGVLALYNKKSPIEVYFHIVDNGIGLRCAIGDVDQFNSAVQTATEKQLFVPDITALLTLYEVHFVLPDDLPKFIIGSVTSDLIDHYIHSKSIGVGSDHMSIFEYKGQKMRMVLKAEHKKAELKHLEGFRDWVKQVTEIRPCLSLLDKDDKHSKQFRNTMGADVFESALLSAEVGGIYISDDAANRRFVLEQLHVNSIWTQPYLKALTLGTAITEDAYNGYVYRLLQMKHQHTTVDKNDIMLALHKSNFETSGPFEAMVNVLTGYQSNEQSVQIAFAVIADIWQLDLNPKHMETLTYYILMRFMTNRTIYPLVSKLSRISDYFITEEHRSIIVKHTIWQLMSDYGFPMRNPTRFFRRGNN
jgi:tetratricopeptide (TPR) repeat protein